MNTTIECDIGVHARVFFARTFPCLLTCILILAAPMPAAAKQAPRDVTYELDIDRKTRRDALLELSRKAGMELVYAADNTEEKQALVGPIKGTYTMKAALRTILRGSRLTHRIADRNTLVVETRTVEAVKRPETAVVTKPVDTVLPHAAQQPVEEVVVPGWPWRTMTTDSAAPASVLDRRQLDATGAPTLSEAMRYIPQSAYIRPEGYYTSGAQYAEMRGLGSDTALILINGRRAMPSASSLTSSAFDLNTIPLAAVERIEFFPGSAAVEYGTDAIGGVINIVLREVAHPTIEVRHGAAAGGAEQERGTLRLGTQSDRFASTLILDYFDTGGLLGAERDRWSNQDHRRFGGKDQRSPLSVGGNIVSADGYNLPGLAAPFAAVPLVDATPGVGRDDFAVTAGTRNMESLFKYWSVVPEATRTSLVATAAYELSDALTVSAEVLYADRNSAFFFYPPALNGMPVPPTNAFNPFGTTVLAFRLIPELGSQYQSLESEFLRTATQLQGRWARWDLSMSMLHSRERASTWTHNELDFSADGAVMRALASSDPTLALNPFQSGPMGSEELLRSLVAPRQVDTFRSVGKQVIASARGPLFRTHAGPATAMLGAEWRQESGLFDSRDMGRFDSARNIRSAFLQLQVPLVGRETALPAMQRLSVVAASRADRYDGMDTVIRSQYGLQWNPLRSLNVRVSAGRNFRPPSLYELNLPKIATPFRVRDPARDHELANITLIVGGNRELKPATAKTFTAGVEFAPNAVGDWKICIDYWRVTMNDRVSALSPSLLLANESLFPDRITRAAGVEADSEGGRPRALQAVDISRINAGRVEAGGIDFIVRSGFETRLGYITPELRATWFESFLSTDLPGQPAVNRVNLASELGSILEWRAIASLGWSHGPYGITTAARYSPSYDDAVAGVRTGHEVASQTLIDLHGSVDLGRLFGTDSAWSGLNLAAGVLNLFDEEPSVAEVGGAAEFDLSQGDLKQNSYYIRIQKQF